MKKWWLIVTWHYAMDIFYNFENACLFKKMETLQTSRGFERARSFHEQSILYINICFRKHLEENLFNVRHSIEMDLC